MSRPALNGQPVGGRAVSGRHPGAQRIRAAITSADSPAYQTAGAAVLASDLEVTLQGEAHEPLRGVVSGFRATGRLVNGRAGRVVRADLPASRLRVFRAFSRNKLH